MISVPGIKVNLPTSEDDTNNSSAKNSITDDNRVPEKWCNSFGEDVKVAVIDTGWSDHKSLNFSLKASAVGDSGKDKIGHGTHVAGIIAAKDIGIGISGIAPKCQLAGIKAVPGDWFQLSNALRQARRWGAHVINFSCGTGDAPTREFLTSLDACYQSGIIVVASAGNSRIAGQNTITYPARCDNVIPVAALTGEMIDAPFSASGSELERGYSMPGVEIASTWLGNNYAKCSGTSTAAPQITGIIALILGKHFKDQGSTPIGQGPSRVEGIIQHLDWACQSLGDPLLFGRGYIDASKL